MFAIQRGNCYNNRNTYRSCDQLKGENIVEIYKSNKHKSLNIAIKIKIPIVQFEYVFRHIYITRVHYEWILFILEKAGREQIVKNSFHIQSLLTCLEVNISLYNYNKPHLYRVTCITTTCWMIDWQYRATALLFNWPYFVYTVYSIWRWVNYRLKTRVVNSKSEILLTVNINCYVWWSTEPSEIDLFIQSLL